MGEIGLADARLLKGVPSACASISSRALSGERNRREQLKLPKDGEFLTVTVLFVRFCFFTRSLLRDAFAVAIQLIGCQGASAWRLAGNATTLHRHET